MAVKKKESFDHEKWNQRTYTIDGIISPMLYRIFINNTNNIENSNANDDISDIVSTTEPFQSHQHTTNNKNWPDYVFSQ